jgi:hypothetical protein
MQQKGTRSQSLTIPEPDETDFPEVPASQVHKRVTAMVDHLSGLMLKMNEHSPRGSTMAKMLSRITKEAINDLQEAPPEIIAHYFEQVSAMMYWAATGLPIANIPFPEGFSPDLELYASDYQEAVAARPDPEAVDRAIRESVKLAHAQIEVANSQ